MLTILVASDLSEASRPAEDWARELATAKAGRLCILHVLERPKGPGTLAEEASHQALREPIRADLEKRVEEFRQEGLDCEARIEQGPTVETILEVAGQKAADLIAIGTRGRTGISHVLLGNTAMDLLSRSSTPVLTVPSGLDRKVRLRRILVPTDLTGDTQRPIEAAMSVLPPADPPVAIRLIHIFPRPAGFYRFDREPAYPATILQERMRAQRQLEHLARAAEGPGRVVDSQMLDGNAGENIGQAARDWNADLVAMETAGRSGLSAAVLGSTARWLLPRSKCPVLTCKRAD